MTKFPTNRGTHDQLYEVSGRFYQALYLLPGALNRTRTSTSIWRQIKDDKMFHGQAKGPMISCMYEVWGCSYPAPYLLPVGAHLTLNRTNCQLFWAAPYKQGHVTHTREIPLNSPKMSFKTKCRRTECVRNYILTIFTITISTPQDSNWFFSEKVDRGPGFNEVYVLEITFLFLRSSSAQVQIPIGCFLRKLTGVGV